MSGSIGANPISLYLQYSANETKYAQASLQANPQAASLIAYFNANAAAITTPSQLLGNYKLLSVVLGAFNLQASINDTALLKQLMTQDPSSSTSLAQKLGNQAYLQFANALSDWSTPPFASASTRAQVVSSFTENTFEQSANSQAPGLGLALYFAREASTVTTLTQLQADPNLLKVAVATSGVPYLDFGALDFTQQTRLLNSSLKVSELSQPSYVNQVAEQYLIQQSQDAAQDSTPADGSLASLFADDSESAGDAILNILDPGSTDASDTASSGQNVLSLFA